MTSQPYSERKHATSQISRIEHDEPPAGYLSGIKYDEPPAGYSSDKKTAVACSVEAQTHRHVDDG